MTGVMIVIKITNNKLSFTIVESVIILFIFAFIATITAVAIINIKANMDILTLRKSILDFNSALDNVLKNRMYYSEELGLADLNLNDIDDNIVINNAEHKFRELMHHELEIDSSTLTGCAVITSESEITENGDCYKRDNGVIFSIPDAKFYNNSDNSDNKQDLIAKKSVTGAISYYLPVTIYPNAKFIKSKEDFMRYAIVIGVRRDGATINLNTIDCSDKSYSKYNQCKVTEYLTKKSFER